MKEILHVNKLKRGRKSVQYKKKREKKKKTHVSRPPATESSLPILLLYLLKEIDIPQPSLLLASLLTNFDHPPGHKQWLRAIKGRFPSPLFVV